jgi:hypothetical protein
MIALANGLTLFGEPVLLLALIVLVFALLQAERIWTRSRRKRGLEPGAMAYLLDGLVLAGVALTLVGIGTLFVHGLTSIAALLGGVFDGQRIGLLIVGMAMALGLALALARVASGRRAPQDAAGALVRAPHNLDANMAGPAAAGDTERNPAYAPASEGHDDEPLPSFALLQERWQPAAARAASAPTSFLELAEPAAPTRSRSRLAPALLTLALVVMLVSAAVLFRGQVIGVLAGMSSPGDEAAAQQNAGSEAASANVGVAVAPSATAAPAAIQPAAEAPAPVDEGPGGTKRVKSDALNMSALPGLDQQVVLVLKKGDAVALFTDARLIRDTIWVKVRFGDREGWVDQSLLE